MHIDIVQNSNICRSKLQYDIKTKQTNILSLILITKI
jgi:hypothetical protein